MKKRIVSIAPWASAKTLAAVYFALGIIFAIPVGLISSLSPPVPGQTKPGIGFFILMPILYGLAGLIFVPLGCWIYNKAAGLFGGIEFDLADDPQAETSGTDSHTTVAG